MHDICYAEVMSYHDIKKLRAFFEANYPKECVNPWGTGEFDKDENSIRVSFGVPALHGELLDEFKELSKSLWGFLHVSATDSSVSTTDRHYMFFDGKYVGGWNDDMFETEDDIDDAV